MPDTGSVVTSTEPLVGRRAELALLQGRLADARAGSGHLVLVSAPAGMGKTRLVEELVATADGMPVGSVGWGAAVDNPGMPALWPWTRAVRGMPAPRAAVAALVAGGAGRDHGSVEDAAAATFAADTDVVDALEQQARQGSGLLFVLDDLQWADRATLRLLERVAAEVRRLPLLIVGTHRDATGWSLPAPVVHRATELLSLRPLSRDESAQILTGAVDGADPAAVRHAAELSGGSPLYLRTLSRIAPDQLRGRAPWDDATESPELRHLVAAAMRTAGPEAARAVEAMSVFGPEASPELVARILDVESASAAIERLLPAVPAGLMELPSPDGPVRFAHALVRDAAYASLPPLRRIALHRRAAEILEPLAIARDERAGVVARHWDRAGEPGRAVTWAVRAADAARAAGAHDDAAAYLALALDAVDRGAGIEADRAELLLDLARVEYLAGHLEQSVHTCERAANHGERSGRAEIVARAAIIVQGIGHPAVVVRLRDLCRRALAMLGDDAPPDLRARVEAQLACVLLEVGAFDEARRWSQRALAAATTSGDLNAELDAVRACGAVTAEQPGLDEELFDLGGRAVELAEPTGRPLAALWGYIWRSDSAIHRADLPAAHLAIAAMQVLADRTGFPLVRWHLLRRQSSVAALTGNFDRCRQLAAEAAEIAAEWRDEVVGQTQFGQAVSLALLRGDPADLTPGWTDGLAVVDTYPPIGQAVYAGALLLAGRRDEARVCYDAAMRTLDEVRHGLSVATLAFLAELAPGLGDPAGCRAAREVISRLYAGTAVAGAGTVAYFGSIARMIAELDLGCADYTAAIPHFEEGLRIDSRLGARPFVARGRMGLARARAATGDLPGAVELARAAAADARRMDMPGLLRTADTFLADAAARARAEDPLTSREHEIVELVARALSNREIARTLVLSERTVESHVRRILAKTGLTSRIELTRWFLQQPPR